MDTKTIYHEFRVTIALEAIKDLRDNAGESAERSIYEQFMEESTKRFADKLMDAGCDPVVVKQAAFKYGVIL